MRQLYDRKSRLHLVVRSTFNLRQTFRQLSVDYRPLYLFKLISVVSDATLARMVVARRLQKIVTASKESQTST
jgi:hypothetical protein